MTKIKADLKTIVLETVIPEVEEYLNELHKLLEKNEAKDDDLQAIREMESFLVELQNIVLVVDEDKLSNEEAEEVYQKILNLIEESKHSLE